MAPAPKQRFPVVGFITPPGWYDPSPVEFAAKCEGGVGTQQCLMTGPTFDYALTSVAQSEPEMMIAARSLGAAGCDVVAKVGTPFGWAGLSSEEEARARCAKLAASAGVHAVMTGLAIVDALRALGVAKVALAPTYYSDDWRDAWRSFVTACGFNVVLCESLSDQNLAPAVSPTDELGWIIGEDLISAAVGALAQNPRGAEAIVVTGAGCRTNLIIEHLEHTAGLPVIGADTALFWAAAKRAGVSLKPGALGALTDV
ncbi:MAG: hypothetical protein GY948_04505 [Alphaproteobacteria bacterium]|nr:hypothetical protein [Alphaproteobacteria bacterium]